MRRPSSMTETRPQSRRTSAISWETIRKVTPCSRFMRRIASMMTSRMVVFTPANGSSIRTTWRGWIIRARAICTSIACPPESCLARAWRCRSMATKSSWRRALAWISAIGRVAARARSAWPGSSTFSSTVMFPKSFGIWKVRATPRAAISWGRSRSTRRPSRWISPASRRWRPERMFTVVVLPEPLGPIRPRISPRATTSESPSTATTPPNRLTTPRVSSTGPAPLTARLASPRPLGERVLVYVHAAAGAVQREDAAVGILDRPTRDIAREQERPEELAAPGDRSGRQGQVEVRGGAERGLDHAAHVAAHAGRLRDPRDGEAAEQAAGLRQLEAHDGDRAEPGERERVVVGEARLVGHDRHRGALGDHGEPLEVPARHRLMDEEEAEGLERPDRAERGRPVPALIGVHPERDRGAQGLAEPAD